MMLKIITSNTGKVNEFQKAFRDIGIEVEHFPMDYDEVQTDSLEDVVRNGLDALREKGLKNFLIDDSGMFVDALKGFPGVYSAYGQKTIGNAGILKLMDGIDGRKAKFKCCIGCDIDGETVIVTGICDGMILEREQGEEGFGYDPLFSIDGKRSFAEMPIDEKNAVSHRGLAIRLLLNELKDLL